MYQIVYRDEGRQQKLYGPDVCAGLFRPKMTADGFKRWAREHNCPTTGGYSGEWRARTGLGAG